MTELPGQEKTSGRQLQQRLHLLQSFICLSYYLRKEPVQYVFPLIVTQARCILLCLPGKFYYFPL